MAAVPGTKSMAPEIMLLNLQRASTMQWTRGDLLCLDAHWMPGYIRRLVTLAFRRRIQILLLTYLLTYLLFIGRQRIVTWSRVARRALLLNGLVIVVSTSEERPGARHRQQTLCISLNVFLPKIKRNLAFRI